MPPSTRKTTKSADEPAKTTTKTKVDPVAKQQAIVDKAEAALDKALKALEVVAVKANDARRRVKLAERQLEYERTHPDLEGAPEVEPVIEDRPVAIPKVTPHQPEAVDPMASEAAPWPGDAPPPDPLA